MAAPLTLDPDPNFSIKMIGRETQPLLIIDDCLAHPDAVLAIAARSNFVQHGPHYPGIRAAVPRAACQILIDPLVDILCKTFNLPHLPKFDECYLSLVTTAPRDLQPIQRLPHFDGLEADRLAFLLYLDRDASNGTAFYRQRATGFETVDGERFAEFQKHLQDDIARHGLPDSDYIRGDTALYEQVGKVEGRFNRAVIYRGNRLHCANLPTNFLPSDDPVTGRLTLNLFLRC